MKTIFEGKKLYAVIIAFLLIITFFITFHIIRNHYQYVFKNVITENTLNPEKSIALLDQEGNIIFSNAVPYQEKITKYPDARVLEKAVSGVIIDMEIADAKEKGSLSYVSIAPVKGMGWSVIVGQEKNAILKSLYGYSILSAVTGFVIFLFLAVSLLYFRKEHKYMKTKEFLQTEEVLRKSKRKYKELFERISSGVAVYEAVDGGEDFIFLDFNAAGEAIEQVNREDIIGKRVTEVFPGVKAFGVFEVFQRVWKTGESEYLPERFYKDERDAGSWRESWVYKLPGGEIAAVYNDITSRKQTEEALRESERKFRVAQELSPDGFTILRPIRDARERVVDFTWVYENATIARLNGTDPKAVVGRRLLELFPGHSGSQFLRAYQLVAESGEHCIFEDGYRGESMSEPTWFRIVVVPMGGDIAILAQDITERKQAEEALKKSAQLLRDTGEMAKVGGWELDLSTNEVSWTEEVGRIHGVEPGYKPKLEEAMNFYAPESRPALEEALKKAAETGEPYDLENLFIPSGSKDKIWVRSVGMAVYSDGKIVKLAGTFQNIDKYKRAEEALHRSEENFRRSLEGSPLGVRIVTEDGETIYANRAILDIYGYDSIEEFKTTSVEKRYTPESHAEFSIRREKRKRGDYVPSEYDISIVKKDGEVRHLQVFRKDILWDGNRQYQVLYNDITERKRVEDTLRESEERYRTLIETSRDLIYTADRKGSITYMNPALEKILGYTPHELNGKSFAEILAPDFVDKARDLFRRAMKGELIPVYEAEMIRKDGGRNTLEFNVETLYDKKGKPAGRYGIGRDITDRRRVEEELRTSRKQLRDLAERQQRAREEERRMIAREIHDEMGGGLTGLKMDLSWMSHKMSDADPGEERVALMDKIQAANALIDQMIQVVRRISTDLRPSILDDLGLIAALEWQLSEFTRRTEIPHEFATTFEYVNMEEGTATAVFRISQEALTNVVRHAQATKVAVVLREGERSLFGDESLVLEIRDNGRGITEEEIQNSESLGLLGMKERVMTFGGALSIRGEPGGGTALILKIPRKQGDLS